MNSRESSNEPQDVDPPGNDETLSNDEENQTKLDEENIEMKGGDDDNEMQTNDTTEDQPKSSRKRGGRKRRKPGKPTVLKQEEMSKIKTPVEGEIEVSAENSNEEDEPSPVMTRRSNRKLQQQNQEQKLDLKEAEEESLSMDEDHGMKLENDPDQEPLDDAESVASELDSVASSTLTSTRGSRRNRNQDSQFDPKKKTSRTAKPKNSNNGTANTKG